MCGNVIRENKFKVKTLKKGQIKNFPIIITHQEDEMVMKQYAFCSISLKRTKGS